MLKQTMLRFVTHMQAKHEDSTLVPLLLMLQWY